VIAVDSSVWIDFLTDRPTPQVGVLESFLMRDPTEIALIDIVLTEVLRGLRDEEVARVESQLAELDVLRMQWMTDFQKAAALYRAARKSGVTIRSTVDCLIAAVCIRAGVPLLHSDVDFERLSDVSELATIRAR
jgi:predicted nucleic acid-binding protein